MNSICLKNIRRVIAIFIATVMAILATSSTHAGVIVSISHVSVAPGGSGYLDVLIHSSGTDTFQNYFLQFTISGSAQAADPINFVASVLPAPQLFATSPDYIFLGDSAEATAPIGLDSVSDQPGSPIADDLITVVDLTDSGFDRTILFADGNFLLARLNFIAPLSATPGNVYDINLDLSTSYFEDMMLNQQTIDPLNVNIGSITISSAVVPEPSTFALMAMVGAGVVGRKLRRRKTENLQVENTESRSEG